MSPEDIATFPKMGEQSRELRSQDKELLDSLLECAEQSGRCSEERVRLVEG